MPAFSQGCQTGPHEQQAASGSTGRLQRHATTSAASLTLAILTRPGGCAAGSTNGFAESGIRDRVRLRYSQTLSRSGGEASRTRCRLVPRASHSWSTLNSKPSAVPTGTCTSARQSSARREDPARRSHGSGEAALLRSPRCRHSLGQDDLDPHGRGRDEAASLTHLTTCRGWARSLEAEGRQLVRGQSHRFIT